MTVRITAVCLGNICRSPMAEAVLRAALTDSGIPAVVDSAGTGAWHLGEGADRRALSALRRRGYALDHEVSHFTADRFDPAHPAHPSLVLAMDSRNLRSLHAMAPDDAARATVRMMREFAPDGRLGPTGLDIPDPYDGDDSDFDRVLDMLEAATPGVVEYVSSATP